MKLWWGRRASAPSKPNTSSGVQPSKRAAAWDLTALLNAADARASQAERNIWLIRLVEWLRRRGGPVEAAEGATPNKTLAPVLRLRHLLNVLDRNDGHRAEVQGMLRSFLADADATSLLADFGFAPRMGFVSELAERARLATLPGTPQTNDLGEVFHLLFTSPGDAAWLEAIDDETLDRLVALFAGDAIAAQRAVTAPSPLGPADARRQLDWRSPVFDAIDMLVSQIRAAGFSTALRRRMDASALIDRPFHQLSTAADAVRDAALHSDEAGDPGLLLAPVQYLRALLDACRTAADSVRAHLEEYGVSVDVVFQAGQLRERTERVDALLSCVLASEPSREMMRLLSHLVRIGHERRSARSLFARHYSLLARKVAERSAETGERYITRDQDSYYAMVGKALGGGAVIAITTFIKFLVMAVGFSAFWSGFWAGINYAGSFVLIHLMHWTVATKQPAMTAPAMAAKLEDVSHDAEVEAFVDEVANLIRSQVAGIVGNLIMCAPVVILIQWLCRLAFGMPLVGQPSGQHAMDTLTLWGPTLLYAAFTGILLFASSIIAGWVENWFVWHRIDSAIEWNPRIRGRLGAPRAKRWAHWWRINISGLASNVSLGLMLGLVPAIASFFGAPIEVRHVTLSTGQLAAAAGAFGWQVLHMSEFWWCVAAIPLTGVLNVAVSFLFAFKVAMRSRGLKVSDRSRIYRAIRRRLRRKPGSFLWPTRAAPAAGG